MRAAAAANSHHHPPPDKMDVDATGAGAVVESDERQPVISRDGDGSGRDRTPTFVYILTCMSAIGGFLFGYDTGVISGAMVIIKDQFNLDTVWQELIVSVTIGAAAVFAAIGGTLNDLFGRKPVIMFASIVFTAGAVCMGVANSKDVLLVGRFIVGAGIGLVSMTVPMYIAESAPAHIRGRLVTVNVVFITGGQFVASLIDGAFSYDREDGWRYMLGLAGVPSFLQFVGFLFMPESPRWLVQHGRYDDARRVLRSIRSTSGDVAITAEFDAITASVINTERDEVDNTRVESGGGGASGAGSTRWFGKSTCVQMMMDPALRRALLVGCGLQMFQQLAGINTVMYYSATIIEMSGVKDKSRVIWLASATAATNFLCTFIGLYLVERIGRRPLILLSLAGVIGSLIVLGVGFNLAADHSPHITAHDPQARNYTCYHYSTCNECISSPLCGYCFSESSSPALRSITNTNGTCLPTDPNDFTHSLVGACQHVPPGTAQGTLTWADDWCPTPYSWLTVLGLILYLFCFAPGMGPVPWTVNSEIYPHWARSYGNSAATFTNWTCNLLVSVTFLSLTEWLTRQGTFYLYACISTVGLLAIFLLLPETRGRSLEEVHSLFHRPWFLAAPCGAHSGEEGIISSRRIKKKGVNVGDDEIEYSPLRGDEPL